ncbi:hypothetical protein AKJ16_DCAP15277 [Drosera capensis]
MKPASAPEFVLRWGKRLRCLRVKNPNFSHTSSSGFRRRITSKIVKDSLDTYPSNRKGVEEKEVEEKKGGGGCGVGGGEVAAAAWPKVYVTLSSKEKEEDFMAMKGCKLPQRPKKRAKFIQRTLLLVSPGAWLSDMCQERYEVREKKASKKRPKGLKALGSSMDSDSD